MMASAVASAAVWFYEMLATKLSGAFEPIYVILFFLSMVVFWYVGTE